MKLLTMINQSPWNELILLSGSRDKVGGNVINHRGLILLYTSKTKPDSDGMDEMRELVESLIEVKSIDPESEANSNPPRGVIVGAALLRNCSGEPGNVTYDIHEARRFPKPVPIVNRGPVRWFSIKVNKAIERQLCAVGMWDEARKANREFQK